jgi:putative transposase
MSHALYRSLGNTGEARQMAYRDLFRHELELGDLDKIRRATNGNFALGTDRFFGEVSKTIAHRVSPGKAGRPRKSRDKEK